MYPIIDRVKAHAVNFEADLQEALQSVGKSISALRVRVIGYKDYIYDDDPLVESRFFELPDESVDFKQFVDKLRADGGGDEPESGLEALATAIRSDWNPTGMKNRQVIVVWTDASAHELQRGRAESKTSYPDNMPTSFDELTDLWEGQMSPVSHTSKRLIIFAPDAAGWNEIGTSWEGTIHVVSRAGEGLAEVDYKTILDTVANSV